MNMRKGEFLNELYRHMQSEGIDNPQQHVSLKNGKLIIRDCKLYRLPEVLEEFANGIKSLTLIGLTMVEFPEVILELTYLHELILIGTNIERINSLEKLCNLEVLTISLCPMYVIGSLRHMTKLKLLNLSRTRLNAFPLVPSVNQIVKLSISNTNITTLPKELRMPELEDLDISFTPIITIPPKWLSIKMKTLNVGHSSIITMPEEFSGLVFLENLNIAYTSIKELPGFARMENLKRVEISNTELNHFPFSGQYNNLEYLGMCMCEFDDFPESFVLGLINGGMVFYDSRGEWIVDSFSRDIEYRKRIPDKGVFIHGLILKKMDVRYLKQGTSTRDFIKVYYQAEDRVPGHEVKIVVLGDANSGKSMLIENLFELNKTDNSIKGLHIYQDSSLLLPELHQDSRLRVWEVHNTPQLELINPLFLTEECLYIVVLDARIGQDIYQAARHWLSLIEKFAPYDHILFVLTFCEVSHTKLFDPNTIFEKGCLLKLNPDDVVGVRMDEMFMEEDIRTFRKTMAAIIKRMAAYHHEYPIAWKRAERQLTSLLEARSIISYSRFEEICEYYGIGYNQEHNVSKVIISSFLRWLKETGAVQYLDLEDIQQDDRKARWLFDSVWFAEGVSNITSFSADKYGRVTYTELFECSDDWAVLGNEQYSNDNIRYLAHVLHEEGLCSESKNMLIFPTMDSIFSDLKNEITYSKGKTKEDQIKKTTNVSNLNPFAEGRNQSVNDWVKAVLADEGHIHYRIDCTGLSIDFLARIIPLIFAEDSVDCCEAGYEGAIFGFSKEIGGGSLVILCTFGVIGRVDIYASSQVKNIRHKDGNNFDSQQRRLNYMCIAMQICNRIFSQYKAIKYAISVEITSGDQSAFLPLSEIEGCINRRISSYYFGSLERWFTVNPDLAKYVTYSKF